MKEISGIYIIKNIINNKVYVGESINILKRWEQHTNELKSNCHHSYKLQNDWNLYGENNFEFKIIKTFEREGKDIYRINLIMIVYESMFMKEFNSLIEGYNCEDTLDVILSNPTSRINNIKNKPYNLKDVNMLKNIIKNIDKNDGVYVKKEKLSQPKNTLIYCVTTGETFINPTKASEQYGIKNRERVLKSCTYECKIKSLSGKVYEFKFIEKEIKPRKPRRDRKNKEDEKCNEIKQIDYMEYGSNPKFREFISHYILLESYAKIFKKLREVGVFYYKYINNKKYNFPTDKYAVVFIIDDEINCRGESYIGIRVKDEYIEHLKNYLIKLNLIKEGKVN